VITPVDEVGTDPRMADNFLASKSTSGAFEGKKVGVLFGPELSADAQTSDLVIHAAVGAALGHPLASVRDAVGSFHRVLKTPADQPRRGYKARPLSGIWASAPYLHNGSIPSLVELLKAPGERVTAFAVGNREFDPATVGLAAMTAAAGSSAFDVSLPGNSNSGHTYGTGLDADSKRDLLEYLKSL
jgi:cytochrome c peroxidase